MYGQHRTEHRTLSDRRRHPSVLTGGISTYERRRKKVRRAKDRGRHWHIDIYDTPLWIALLSILFLSLIDGCLTLLLVNSSIASEMNPVMSFYLYSGPRVFAATKYFFTAASVLLFCVAKDFAITKFLLLSAIAAYLSVVGYEINILISNAACLPW